MPFLLFNLQLFRGFLFRQRPGSAGSLPPVAVPVAPDLFTVLPPPRTTRTGLGRAAPSSRPGPSPEELHPALWRAHQLGGAAQVVCASGHAALDAQLPGGGWPQGVLTELLLPHPGVGELRLLAPVLAALQAAAALRDVVGSAHHAQCLGAGWHWGWTCGAWCWCAPGAAQPGSGPGSCGKLPAADMLWALEHALKSGHLGALLAWLPARLPTDALRRLQLAAQSHDGPVFLLRSEQERSRPSAAPLRLLLASAGPDQLHVTLLKRRGPPLATPLTLALPPVLSPPALARALQGGHAPGRCCVQRLCHRP